MYYCCAIRTYSHTATQPQRFYWLHTSYCQTWLCHYVTVTKQHTLLATQPQVIVFDSHSFWPARLLAIIVTYIIYKEQWPSHHIIVAIINHIGC
jgi:hypothetical protein